ncbi:MAG: OmpA family protein, partial [Bacteroidota bacterium]
GENVAGITVHESNRAGEPYRDYLQGQLVEPLRVGEKYHFSFWVHYHCSGSNNIGIVFVPEPISAPGDGIINLLPVTYQREVENYSTEKTWALVEGEFVARRSYKNFIIGNFFSNEETKLEETPYAHYFAYIDDVTVTLVEKATNAPAKTEASSNDETEEVWATNEEVINKAEFTVDPTRGGLVQGEEDGAWADLNAAVSSEPLLMFSQGEYRLSDAHRSRLDEVARLLQATKANLLLELNGHTSTEGTIAQNAMIARKRAQAVADYLITTGVPEKRLLVKSYGEMALREQETSPEKRRANRRVEMVLIRLQ